MEKLEELAGCICCCHEHTHGGGCPAYAWGGCRGQGSDDPWNDEEEWFAFYERTTCVEIRLRSVFGSQTASLRPQTRMPKGWPRSFKHALKFFVPQWSLVSK